MYSIDIDIGGTFTDGFFTDGSEVRTGKVLTTPHDITECFMDCVAAGSAAFGLDLGEFLRRCAVARVSTTVGTNLLVQRSGPRIGLIVTRGAERTLYGDGEAAIVGRYLPADMVRGVREAVDDKGRIVAEVDQAELLAAVRDLIHAGARMIVVSFANAWRNAHNERLARRIVRERYPVHYLRSVPLQIATEVMHVDDDYARTNSAALNAYIHSDMARTLYRAEDRLRAAGYGHPLLVVHSSGGNARVAKTVALHTLQSGPAVATRGAAVLADMLGLDKVVTMDMGGTSLDMAVIVGGEAAQSLSPSIDGVRVATPMIEVDSLGAGGGSIAAVEGASLRVGPESAGSAPGPACYGKGGLDPTVTDANLVLGYIDPGNFLGGRMTLDIGQARRAIDRAVGRRLGVGVEDAAFRIRESINRQMADDIAARLRRSGHDVADFTLFSFGGSGPLHGCAVAELLGIRKIMAFPYGSVFSAFGSSTTKVRHSYMRTVGVPAARGGEEADAIFDAFREQASRDMVGEGFAPDAIRLAGEVEIAHRGRAHTIKVGGRAGRIRSALARNGAKGTIRTLTLTAECDVPHWMPASAARRPKARGTARPGGTRGVAWPEGTLDTPVYQRSSLRPWMSVDGPAIVEGPDTCYAVGPGWRLDVDGYGNFVLTR